MITRVVYVSSHARTWNTMHVEVPDLNTRVALEGPGLGFLTVYLTEDEALRDNPGSSVFPITVPETWVRHAFRDAPRGDA